MKSTSMLVLIMSLFAALLSGCNRPATPAAVSAAATATAAAPTPYPVGEIDDRSEAEGWANYVLSYNYCSGRADPQRYTSTPMQRTLEAIVAENRGQETVTISGWEIFRMSDGRVMAALPFAAGGETKRIEFLVRPERNEILARNSFAAEAIQRVRDECPKRGG